MPGEKIAPGKLVSAMLTLVGSISSVCGFSVGQMERGVGVKETNGISCAVLHVEDE